MQKVTILKFFLPIAILASIFSGPLYNLLLFLNIWVIETHLSLFFDPIFFSTLIALSFILFTVIFIISTRYIEKLMKEQFMILGILLIGFCCIFASLIWVLEIVIMVFFITSAATAFLIPIFLKYTSNIAQKKYENKQLSFILPLSALIWISISFLLFNMIGIHWRFLYLITGVINILSSLVFVFI